MTLNPEFLKNVTPHNWVIKFKKISDPLLRHWLGKMQLKSSFRLFTHSLIWPSEFYKMNIQHLRIFSDNKINFEIFKKFKFFEKSLWQENGKTLRKTQCSHRLGSPRKQKSRVFRNQKSFLQFFKWCIKLHLWWFLC